MSQNAPSGRENEAPRVTPRHPNATVKREGFPVERNPAPRTRPPASNGGVLWCAERIYLDHAAATPLCSRAREAMEAVRREYGNPSSLHEEGRRASAILYDARSRVARVINASPDEIIFTGSGSEADALAIRGAARAYRARGMHIVVSAIEHKAVLLSAAALLVEGFSVTKIAPDGFGLIEKDKVLEAISPQTTILSVMYANNEIGTVEPIAEISHAVSLLPQKQRPLFHTDACQAPGALPLDVKELGVDLMTLNSSKVYGPKGVGALFVRRGVHLAPLIRGEQERGLRGGTENVALIAGFAVALEEGEKIRRHEAQRLTQLRDFAFGELTKRIPGVSINGHRKMRLPNNIHVSFPGVEGEALLLLLDNAGIAAATGSACNSFDLAPSHVLLAIGEEAGLSHGSIRLTLGRSTKKRDVRRAIERLVDAVGSLRKMSSLTTSLRHEHYARKS